MSKRTTIVNPDGSKTVIIQETRGCGWHGVNFVLLMIVIGIPLAYFPILVVPTIAVLLILALAATVYRRKG